MSPQVSRVVVGLMCVLCLFNSLTVNAKDVIYDGEERKDYFIDLLKQALSYSKDVKYEAKAFGSKIPKLRSLDLLEQNDGMDIIIGSASIERVNRYQAIHFPLLKGLNGWRVGLVHKSKPYLLANVESVQNLKKYTVGQFHTWTDSEILEKNGLPIVKGGDLEGLYKMVAKQRLDYFPRSVIEVNMDHYYHRHLPIAIEKSLLIHYPAGYYFYVSKENTELAKVIKAGLEAALVDGNFDRIFNSYYGKVVDRLRAENRSVVRLENPLLPEGVPINRSELWIDFEQFTQENSSVD